MAVEGLKRVYETPYIKGRVDIVKEQTRHSRQEKRGKEQKKSLTKKQEGIKEQLKKGIIDIVV